MLILQGKVPHLILDKNFQKPGGATTQVEFIIFLWNYFSRILHSNVFKNICGSYFIFLHSENIKEYLKRPGVYKYQKTMFSSFSW